VKVVRDTVSCWISLLEVIFIWFSDGFPIISEVKRGKFGRALEEGGRTKTSGGLKISEDFVTMLEEKRAL